MFYLLIYDVVDAYIERRAPFRAEHLALAQAAHERGEIVMAGAFADPVDGAAFVWNVDDPAVIHRFVESDPYVRNGLVTSWRLREWTVVIGAGAAP